VHLVTQFYQVSRLSFGGATPPLPLYPHGTHTNNFVIMLCDCLRIGSFSGLGRLVGFFFFQELGSCGLGPSPNEVGHFIIHVRDSLLNVHTMPTVYSDVRSQLNMASSYFREVRKWLHSHGCPATLPQVQAVNRVLSFQL